jgi:hypothetical protein
MGSPAQPFETVVEPAVEPRPGPAPVTSSSVPARELPRLEPLRDNATLSAKAAQLGKAAGTALNKARGASSRALALTERIRSVPVRQAATDAVNHWRRSGERKVLQICNGATQMVMENPLYVIGGAAVLAFALGFTVRIWRSSHARS